MMTVVGLGLVAYGSISFSPQVLLNGQLFNLSFYLFYLIFINFIFFQSCFTYHFSIVTCEELLIALLIKLPQIAVNVASIALVYVGLRAFGAMDNSLEDMQV